MSEIKSFLQGLNDTYGKVNSKGERFNALLDLSSEADLEREEAMKEKNRIWLNDLTETYGKTK
jgi:hypothetical protein